MIEEMLPDFFLVTLPLPGSYLDSMNIYLIRSSSRALMVDTGLNQQDNYDAVISAMKLLGINRNRTDFFISHTHQDHIGLLHRLIDRTSIVYINQLETDIFRGVCQDFESIGSWLRRNGFPEKQLKTVSLIWHGLNGYSDELSLLNLQLICPVKEGQDINVGEYRFRCIHTPGHSPGHTCLYEPDRKILIAGDHILDDITPNISCLSEDKNPLSDYMESLYKIMSFEIEYVLPGHRRPFYDHSKRVQDILEHHKVKLNQVLGILRDFWLSAYEIAAKMTWNANAESWNDFSAFHQFMATSECLAYLRHLEEKGLIRRRDEKGKIRFSSIMEK